MQKTLYSGDTLIATIAAADYPASAGWTLKGRFAPVASGTAVTVTAVTAEDGADYVLTVPAATTGGWDKAFGVGWRDNTSAYTPDEWAPPYFGVGSLRAQARTFSGSTYVPTSGFATCAVQSLSYDLGGTARRQDGTGASGAYES